MSLPVADIRYAGVWDVARRYVQHDMVLSSITNTAFVYVSLLPLVGGPDPSVQPSTNWIPYPTVVAPFTPAYASFIDTTTYTLTPNVPFPIPYSSSTIAAGVSFAGSGLSVLVAGIYKVVYSVQADKTSGGGTSALLNLYISLNGTPIPDSNSVSVITNSTQTVLTCEYVLSLLPTDTLEVVAETTGTNVRVLYIAPVGATPASPSVITNVIRIG